MYRVVANKPHGSFTSWFAVRRRVLFFNTMEIPVQEALQRYNPDHKGVLAVSTATESSGSG